MELHDISVSRRGTDGISVVLATEVPTGYQELSNYTTYDITT